MLQYEKKTSRQLILELQEGSFRKLIDPRDTSITVAQIVLLEGIYFVTGPLVNQEKTFDLSAVLKMGMSELSAKDTAEVFNEVAVESGLPPEALIYLCTDAEDAINTLQGLYLAY